MNTREWCFIGAVATGLVVLAYSGWWLWDRAQVKAGIIDAKVEEPEARWWADETECALWVTVPVASMCGQSMCTSMSTHCGAWRRYQQERIDDADWVINVLGPDGWGDLKMRRVYLDMSTWSRLSPGAEWSAVEFPDQGDWHSMGERRG